MMRHLKIFWHCPEIRRQIVLHWFWRAVPIIVFIFALPFYFFSLAAEKVGGAFVRYVSGPLCDYCERRSLAARESAHDRLPPKDIKRRAFGKKRAK